MKAHYDVFRDYLEDACGILLGENKQYLVNSRLNRLMLDNEIKDLADLVERLRREPRAYLRQSVIDAMTTNETLWFRDIHPFNILKKQLLPEKSKQGGLSRLRIWSAACSTGQEPYSIVMSVQEYKRIATSVLSVPVEVLATDLSVSVLEAAQNGIYDGLSVSRGLNQEHLRQYFDKRDAAWEIKPAIKQGVRFQRLNLQENFSQVGKFDIVFCRNVLIYFSAERKVDILRRIHATLNPGGYLLLGASEGLNGLGDLYHMVQCHPGIIYQAL